MGFSNETKVDKTWKNSLDKALTSTKKAYYEEAIGAANILFGDSVWVSDLPTDPSQAVTQGLAIQYADLTLTEDVTVEKKQGWLACAVVDNLGTRIRNWIPPKFGVGYNIRLYEDNGAGSKGTEIFTADNINWLFDYGNGILFLENQPTGKTTPFHISGYVYTGLTATSISSGASGLSIDIANQLYLRRDGTNNAIGTVHFDASGTGVVINNNLTVNNIPFYDDSNTQLTNLLDATSIVGSINELASGGDDYGGEYVKEVNPVTRLSNTQFRLEGDFTSRYVKDRLLKTKYNGTPYYHFVESSVLNSGYTTVTINNTVINGWSLLPASIDWLGYSVIGLSSVYTGAIKNGTIIDVDINEDARIDDKKIWIGVFNKNFEQAIADGDFASSITQAASAVTFSPTGNIQSTNVQDAIVEVSLQQQQGATWTTYSASGNNSTVDFILPHTVVQNSENVFLNGLLSYPSEQYEIQGGNTVHFYEPPSFNWKVFIKYQFYA